MLAHSDVEAQAVKAYLSGQKLLVTYRQGGPVDGNYFSLEVHLGCSGTYLTFGRSCQQCAVYNDVKEVHSWRDQGSWEVRTLDGQVGIQYLSMSGSSNFMPIRMQSNGCIAAGNGLLIIRQGDSQCP